MEQPRGGTWHGSCHCKNITVTLTTSKPADELWVRACTCSYCVAQGARYTSDGNGSLNIRVGDDKALIRYRFGHSTADFLVCGRCGVYIGAYMEHEGKPLGVTNINVLNGADDFREGEPVSYESETEHGRLERRSHKWTPATLTAAAEK